MAFRFNINNTIYYADDNLNLDSESIISNNELFQLAKNSSGNPVWYFQEQEVKPAKIFLIREVLNRTSNEVLGTLVCKVNEDYLFGTIHDF